METPKTVKVLPVDVLRNAAQEDSSCNGISARRTRLLLLHEEGPLETPDDAPNLIRLMSGETFGQQYDYVIAVNPGDTAGKAGPMFGGNFVYSGDSRFPSVHPIPIYDRYETPARDHPPEQ